MKSSLTLTNKRLIATSSSPLHRTHDEIPVETIKGISAARQAKSTLPAILCMILGGVAVFSGIALATTSGDTARSMYSIGFVMIVFGALVFSILSAMGGFTLLVSTAGKEGEPLTVGAVSRSRWGRAGYAQTNVKAIKVNKHVADEIIDTLGALVLDIKRGK